MITRRDVAGNGRTQTGKNLKMDEIKAYVLDRIKVGDLVTMQRDVYNVDHARIGDLAEKEVIDFYTNYLLTVDDYGRRETYGWYDLYIALQNGMKVRPKPKEEKKDESEEIST